MLPRKIRFASLTAIALFVMVVPLVAQAPPASVGQKPAQPKMQERKLQDLLEERLAAARELAKQTKLRFTTNQGTVDEALEPTRLAHEAALDLCKTDQDRVQVLSNFLDAAKENERIALAFQKAGQGRETTALLAKVERLRVEIALARAKARVAAKADGGDKGDAVQPKKADTQRFSVQVGTIQACESIQVFARVPGVLKIQTVDIGDRVKRGQVLANLDVPDLEAQLRLDRAALTGAQARVHAAKSRVKIAEADLQGVILAVKQAEAAVKSAAAWVKFRELQFKRMKDLFKTTSVEESLVNESKERHASAVESENSATAAVMAAKAHVVTGRAKLEQAQADLVGSEADVRVAEVKLEKSQVQLTFATIVAPFDGVITQRNYFPGDFIRSVNNAANLQPLLTLQRTNLVRVVVLIPDRDVPFLQVGNSADVEIDALPGKKYAAKVSRIAVVLDPTTRLMKAELDLGNPTGLIRPGMYGKVAIRLGNMK